MNKKLIIGLLFLVALIIAGMFLYEQEGGKLIPTPSPEPPAEAKTASYGWSTEGEEQAAVDQAVSMMKEGLEGSPNYVLMWYTIEHNPAKLQGALRDSLGSDVQIQANSSAVGVMTPDGYHVGENGSLAILGVASGKTQIGVGGADTSDMAPKQAGKEAIQEAIANSGQQGKPDMVYITATPGREEEILLGIEQKIGTEIPIIGGSSGDETLKGEWSNIANNEVHQKGVTLAAVYTDSNLSTEHEFGYQKTIEKGTVTRADNRTLYEINDRPAAEVYNEWTDGHFDQKLEQGGQILGEASFYPLARIIHGKQGQAYIAVSHPAQINLPEKSLTMYTDVKTGDEIKLLHGNWELLVNRAQSTARVTMNKGQIKKGEGTFAFYHFCAGNLLVIPKEKRPAISRLLTKELGDVPFVAGFTLGEQVFMPGVGSRHANLVNSLAVFGPSE